MPVPVLSRVSIQRVDTYDASHVLNSMRAVLEPVGGMRSFIRPGQRVLLKPNLLFGAAPEKAITTHPSVVRAAAILAQEAGGKVAIGDSPGVGDLRRVAKACGLSGVIDSLGLEIADFSATHVFERPENRVLKRIELAKAVAEADVIISLPKLKTHGQMDFTGALKNQYGLVVGMAKALYHYRLKSREWLADLIIDINRTAKPALAIMDGIVAMEGVGPSGGDPRPMNVLVAGVDLSAVDVLACHLIGLDPMSTPITRAAHSQRFGATSMEEIEVLGENWESLCQPDFRKVSDPEDILRMVPLPQGVLNWLARHLAPRPRIVAEKCTKCLACFRGCPVPPAVIDPRLPRRQQVDDARCIHCYCCHEFCPAKAIRLERTMLDRVLNIREYVSTHKKEHQGTGSAIKS
jgi:uncharacterized protein (DUF362 family)/Pyruvate/2-oxoacid:ferredoxin oxidoreductase delta subunit